MRSTRYHTIEMTSVEIYGQAQSFFAQIKNMSQTGACLHLEGHKLIARKGALLRLTIFLDSIKKTHVVNGEIMWNKGVELGIRFLSQKDIVQKMLSTGRSTAN